MAQKYQIKPDQLNQYRDPENLPPFIANGIDDLDSIAHIHSKRSKKYIYFTYGQN